MRATALAIAFTLLPLAAIAQIGNPGFMAPDTQFDGAGMPEPDQPNNTDKLFAQLVAEGGLAEVSLGQLAADKVEGDAVGEFARMMIDDHSAANERLADLAADSSLTLPDELNPEHAAKRAELEALDGSAFALAYMRAQVVDHQKTTELLIWEIGSGQDAALQQYAAETLPTVLEHLRLARGIVDDLARDERGIY